MRGLKLVVALLAIWSLGLTIFAINLRRGAQRNQDSVETLSNLLEIHRWEAPMPKDTSMEWSFELRDYKEPRVVHKGRDVGFQREGTPVFQNLSPAVSVSPERALVCPNRRGDV